MIEGGGTERGGILNFSADPNREWRFCLLVRN